MKPLHTQHTKMRHQLLLELLYGLKRWAIFGGFCTLVSIAFSYCTPLIVRSVVDFILTPSFAQDSFAAPFFQPMFLPVSAAEMLGISAGLLVFASLLNALFSYFRGHSFAMLGEGFAQNLRNRLFQHLQNLPFSYYSKAQTGDLIQRCTADVDTVRKFIQTQLVQMLRTISMAVLAIAVMLPISPMMTLLSCCLMPILIIFSTIYFQRVQQQFLQADEAEGALSTMLQEHLTGMRVVRAFAQQQAELKRFTEKNRAYYKKILGLNTLMGAYWGLSDTIGYLQIALSLCFGVYFSVSGSFSVGNVLLFTTYTSMLTFPMRNLGRILADLGKANVSFARLEEILHTQVETETGQQLTPVLDGSIVFENVSFDYGGSTVLKNISFSVQPGQTVGILGATGAGKSTLVHLLQRLWPISHGKILLSGIPIEDIERHHLRRNIGLVLQEPFLFSRTIRENITIARPWASEIDMKQAAQAACLHHVIESFPKQYQTMVGERGVTLSGGQKQRTAIARTLLTNAPIMIFDDSLSAVDAKTDAAIRDTLTARKGCTTFLISHRIATVQRADFILVMEQGRIVQQGTHEQLCQENGGLYQRVCELQHELTQCPHGGAALNE